MKQTINLSQFRDAFRDMGKNDNFSYQGLEVLYDSLEELGEDTGNEVELDVIALCCDFSEAYIDEIADNYIIDVSDEDEKHDAVMEYLQDHTYVCGETKEGTVVYQDF